MAGPFFAGLAGSMIGNAISPSYVSAYNNWSHSLHYSKYDRYYKNKQNYYIQKYNSSSGFVYKYSYKSSTSFNKPTDAKKVVPITKYTPPAPKPGPTPDKPKSFSFRSGSRKPGSSSSSSSSSFSSGSSSCHR